MTRRRNLGLKADPNELNFNQAVELLVADDKYTEARAFYDGDHFQDGKAWVGPRLDENDLESEAVMEEIKTSLVSHPAIEEVTDRHKDAVTSEPGWSLVPIRAMKEEEKPNDQEQRLIDEADAALTDWWDDKDALGEMQESVIDLGLGGRGLMRHMVPEGELITGADGETPVIPKGTLEESLSRIWPLFVEADMGEVFRDPSTMRQIGVYVYEVTDIITGRPTQFAELSYLDPAKKLTIIRVVGVARGDGGRDTAQEFGRVALDLGGRLPIFKMESKRLITEPVLSNQKLLNMDLTMMGKNVVLGGFLERVILNGQAPGEWEEDPETGKRKFIPGAFKTGAASENWISGVVTGYDDKGNPIIATPSIHYKDPVTPETFTDTQDAVYKNILQGARQLHVIISGDAVASGESRKQARDDYEKSLKKTKTRVDAMGKWLLESALWQASVFMGQPGRYKSLRVDFDSQIDAGPISAEDRNSMINEVNSNLRSRESYMLAARVTKDPTAMKKKIMEEMSTLNPLANIQLERQRLGLAADRRALGIPEPEGGPLDGNRTPPDNNPGQQGSGAVN